MDLTLREQYTITRTHACTYIPWVLQGLVVQLMLTCF